MYDEGLRRRIGAAVIRDKKGAWSLDYQLSIISDSLLTTLDQRNFGGKLSVWTTILKICLMVPEERFADILPDILEDIIDQYERQARHQAKTLKLHRTRTLILIGQAIMLKRGGLDRFWSTLLARLEEIAKEPSLESSDVSAVLLIILSVISRGREELGTHARQVLPLLLPLLKTPNLHSGTATFGIKLIAIFQSHTEAFLPDIVQTFAGFSDELLDAVGLEVLRVFAYLADYVSLFTVALALDALLCTPAVLNINTEESHVYRQKVSQRVNNRVDNVFG